MPNIKVSEISGIQALKLANEGHALKCPVCSAELKAISASSERVVELVCPVEMRHFLVYAEDAVAVQEMRARMKARKDDKFI